MRPDCPAWRRSVHLDGPPVATCGVNLSHVTWQRDTWAHEYAIQFLGRPFAYTLWTFAPPGGRATRLVLNDREW